MSPSPRPRLGTAPSAHGEDGGDAADLDRRSLRARYRAGYADEYAAYGYDFPKPSVRFAQLEELIQICRLMWTEDHPSFEGQHYSIADASVRPLPDPVPRICIAHSARRSACRSSTSGRSVELLLPW